VEAVEADLQEISNRLRVLPQAAVQEMETVTVWDSHFPRKEVRDRPQGRPMARSFTISQSLNSPQESVVQSISIEDRCVQGIDILRARHEATSMFLTPQRIQYIRDLVDTARDSLTRSYRESQRGDIAEMMHQRFHLDKALAGHKPETSNECHSELSAVLHNAVFYTLPKPSPPTVLTEFHTLLHQKGGADDQHCPERMSEFASGALSLFSGSLLCGKKGLRRFRPRSFHVMYSPVLNPNLCSSKVVKHDNESKADTIYSSTLNSGLDGGFYLVEYRSALNTAWGTVPVFCKQTHSLSRQLLAIISKSKHESDVTLYILDPDDLSESDVVDELRAVSTGIARTAAIPLDVLQGVDEESDDELGDEDSLDGDNNNNDGDSDDMAAANVDGSDEDAEIEGAHTVDAVQSAATIENKIAGASAGNNQNPPPPRPPRRSSLETQSSTPSLPTSLPLPAQSAVQMVPQARARNTISKKNLSPAIYRVYQSRRLAALERLQDLLSAHATLLTAHNLPSSVLLSPLLLVVDNVEYVVPLLAESAARRLLGDVRSPHIELLLREGVRRFTLSAHAFRVKRVRLRAKDGEERLHWIRALQFLAPKDIYVNTVVF
jgi:hypothetical protein